MQGPVRVVVSTALLVLVASGCASDPADKGPVATQAAVAEAPVRVNPDAPRASRPAVPSRPTSAPATDPAAEPDHPPRMLDATVRIPTISMDPIPVVGYRGAPDDGPGTDIQDVGVAASPFGQRGGVGPGQVGNYIVTAHRTTEPAPFADLPSLRRDEHVMVTAGGQVFDYRITGTRSTSFRSQGSLARQAAAVPGHPQAAATRAMLTLSTCATPEDHARGNYWADEFGNPEHRIDKIGVLDDVRPTGRL